MDELKIEDVRRIFQEGNVLWSVHALERMQQRNITKSDVDNAISNGTIIEQYPDAFPYPACLIFGISLNDKILHVVSGCNGKFIKLITVYYPDDEKFDKSGKIRRERN